MQIILSELFKTECEGKFGVTKEQVYEAVTTPDYEQHLKLDELEILFYLKNIRSKLDEYYLLIVGRKIGDDITIDTAFKLLPELLAELLGGISNSSNLEPLIVLQKFAQKFGLTIRIGHQLNKFILREYIPLARNKAALVEIDNPHNHPFVQSIFIKIEQRGNEQIANCALAYCIDNQQYLDWLNKKVESQNIITIDIAPTLRGRITPYDLLHAESTYSFWVRSSEIPIKTAYLFKVSSPEYFLEVGFTPDSIYVKRNTYNLSLPINSFKYEGNVINFIIMWSPTYLKIVALDKSFTPSSDEDALSEIEKRTIKLETPPVIPPNSLFSWARRQMLVPNTVYESPVDFYQEVTKTLQYCEQRIKEANMYDAFWDFQYEGKKIVNRSPKKETQITPSIHGLISDIGLAKNFEIIPEYQTGGGLLDFLFIGHLKTGQNAYVCVEFKHAHSSELEHGISTQLPEYMKSKSCDYGLYCVLYYKGLYFSEPDKYDQKGILLGHYLDMLYMAH